MGINWVEIIIALCGILITGIAVPFLITKYKKEKSELSQDQQKIVTYWTKIGVRWAKQWMQNYEGEAKKDNVLEYLADKMKRLGINIELDDLDKIIEAVYGQIKDGIDVFEVVDTEK